MAYSLTHTFNHDLRKAWKAAACDLPSHPSVLEAGRGALSARSDLPTADELLHGQTHTR